MQRGVDGGRQQAVDPRIAAAEGDVRELSLAEGEPDGPDGGVRGEAHRIASQPPREPDPGQRSR